MKNQDDHLERQRQAKEFLEIALTRCWLEGMDLWQIGMEVNEFLTMFAKRSRYQVRIVIGVCDDPKIS